MTQLPSPDPRAPFLLRLLRSRPRLFACLAIGLCAFFATPSSLIADPVTRALAAWNLCALLYLGMSAKLMFWPDHQRMRSRAALHDEGAAFILALAAASTVACLGAIIGELSVAKDLHGHDKLVHIGLACLTIASSWGFTQALFALHYAHDYYACVDSAHRGGLDFPGGHAPDYADFLYMACVIGTSGQTADVSFTNRRMRRAGLVHCVLAYFFNTAILALMINIASGLL